jgi:hypothetical protein
MQKELKKEEKPENGYKPFAGKGNLQNKRKICRNRKRCLGK